MSEGTGTWWPEGSGQGRVSAAPEEEQRQRISRAETAFLDHVRDCNSCFVDARDCETAAGLRQALRDARQTA